MEVEWPLDLTLVMSSWRSAKCLHSSDILYWQKTLQETTWTWCGGNVGYGEDESYKGKTTAHVVDGPMDIYVDNTAEFREFHETFAR